MAESVKSILHPSPSSDFEEFEMIDTRYPTSANDST
jgi:hypothetical protein